MRRHVLSHLKLGRHRPRLINVSVEPIGARVHIPPGGGRALAKGSVASSWRGSLMSQPSSAALL
jgi:hypothetical protein